MEFRSSYKNKEIFIFQKSFVFYRKDAICIQTKIWQFSCNTNDAMCNFEVLGGVNVNKRTDQKTHRQTTDKSKNLGSFRLGATLL